jgi:succinate dehydrogenase / fumarate reductase membrane anchor subunit
MVTNVTSLTGNGLRDWLVQRVTAVVLGLYFAILLGFFILHPQLNYEDWHSFYQHNAFRVVNVIMIVCLLKHAWIGLWTVTTDYLKCAFVRVSLQMLILFSLFACLIWFLMILWG